MDPSGHESFTTVLSSMAIRNIMVGMAIGAPFRAYTAAKQFRNGIDLGTIMFDAGMGLMLDGAVSAVLPGLLNGLTRFTRVRAITQGVNQALGRAATSVWNIASATARGRAVEQFILGRMPSTLAAGLRNFPVIDDFMNGIATSIKSINLLGRTYSTAKNLASRIVDDAVKLSKFEGARQGAYQVLKSQIEKKVLVVVMEEGVITEVQKQGLIAAVQLAKVEAPFVEIVFRFIP